MVSVESKIDVPTIVTAGRTLALALTEYRIKPTSPERLWNFQEAHWSFNRLAAGLSKSDVVVDDVPYSEDQMRQFRKNEFGLFLPQVFSTDKEGIRLQGKVYPLMRWDVQSVTGKVANLDKDGNPFSLFGWMRTEKAINAPHRKTDEAAAEKAIGDRMGQTLNVYAEAGNQSKLLTGRYLDEVRTWVRILSSRVGSRVVFAYFYPDGFCYVYWPLRPDFVFDSVGVRSVGV